jgi:mRNA-degrading endonuclease RelE of RelBE toxin-antitoxin system
MNFNVEIASDAATELKKLSKKYHSLKKDFDGLLSSLEEDPAQGEPLGKDCFKIRLAISSKNEEKVEVPA